MSARGKHIELFLVDGTASGRITAEIAGWTGHVLAGPRSDLAGILARRESNRNGAYLLIGDDQKTGGVKCYIGRTENLAQRIGSHERNKPFWDRLVLISAKDDAFNEGHWGYLEARLIGIARDAARAVLENGNTPQGRALSEAQKSDMEAFIEQLQIILPVLGVNVIRPRPKATPVELADGSASPIFVLKDAKRTVDARAQVIDDEFVVLQGSQAVGQWAARGKAESTKRSYAAYSTAHEKLIADGTLEVRDGHGFFTRDTPFASPSTAAAVILGRSSNGRTEWKWDGRPYAEWEERGLDEELGKAPA